MQMIFTTHPFSQLLSFSMMLPSIWWIYCHVTADRGLQQFCSVHTTMESTTINFPCLQWCLIIIVLFQYRPCIKCVLQEVMHLLWLNWLMVVLLSKMLSTSYTQERYQCPREVCLGDTQYILWLTSPPMHSNYAQLFGFFFNFFLIHAKKILFICR